MRHDTQGLFRLAVESLPTGVLAVGADGRIALANRKLQEQFGYGSEELLGQPVEMLLPEALRAPHQSDVRNFLSQPVERRMGAGRDVLGRRRDGSLFPVEVSLRPLVADGATFVLAIVVDVTERLEVDESARLRIQEGAEFEQLIASLSIQFINVPADEVGNVIRGALQRIGESLDLDRCTFYRIQFDGLLFDPIGWARSPFPPAPSPIAGSERFPWALEIVRSGRPVVFSSLEEVPNPVDRDSYRAIGVQSALTVPLAVGGQIIGAVGFNRLRAPRAWTSESIHRLQVLASTFASVLARRQSEQALAHALEKVQRLSDQLQQENTYLRGEVRERLGSGQIVGESAAIRRVMELIAQVADTDSTVLLLGETGTGKELFATEIHQRSNRQGRAMVRVNCSAIPATLIESELFGREKGAYTGAVARQIGRFELADQSTLFLDEIGDLPPEVQVKLLRVLEDRQIERLGSPKPIRVNTRIIAATHRDLEQGVASGIFRQDLFYRLNVFPISIPPLRERAEDIPLLVWRFVAEFSKALGKPIEDISPENMAALQRYSWPGNIRELRNVVERAMIAASGTHLTINIPASTSAAARVSTRLRDVETEHIRGVLESSGWRIRGTGGAAERLGLKPTTLETRLIKLGLRRPRH